MHLLKKGGWRYDKKSSDWIGYPMVDDVYKIFEERMIEHREVFGDFSRIKKIACTHHHAIALYASGILTDEMLISAKPPTICARNRYADGHSEDSIMIPKQKIVFEGDVFTASIDIIPAFSALYLKLLPKQNV